MHRRILFKLLDFRVLWTAPSLAWLLPNTIGIPGHFFTSKAKNRTMAWCWAGMRVLGSALPLQQVPLKGSFQYGHGSDTGDNALA